MTVYDYLKKDKEPIPRWLLEIKEGDPFPYQDFFASRIVYYPGSYTDGHAVKVFGSTHSAHSFVYVDYMLKQNELEAEIIRHPFKGYVNLFKIQITSYDLAPNGWIPSISPSQQRPGHLANRRNTAYSFLQILERENHLTEAHGPKRLAVVFLFADGIASYDALFCQKNAHRNPFAVLIHDHGFGGNYDKFGQHGLMNRIADQNRVIPKYLLVAENSQPWSTHFQLEPEGDRGGMYNSPRFLYQSKESRSFYKSSEIINHYN